jgi:hypothetical protein
MLVSMRQPGRLGMTKSDYVDRALRMGIRTRRNCATRWALQVLEVGKSCQIRIEIAP